MLLHSVTAMWTTCSLGCSAALAPAAALGLSRVLSCSRAEVVAANNHRSGPPPSALCQITPHAAGPQQQQLPALARRTFAKPLGTAAVALAGDANGTAAAGVRHTMAQMLRACNASLAPALPPRVKGITRKIVMRLVSPVNHHHALRSSSCAGRR
jgi:hypothetical protein